MTLEDFFTLTEMKDGLTFPSRVDELVTFMKKEKESVVKNVGDATRQWTAVASTIAATESKDCLDLFIQLDGVWFLDKWLKDAREFDNDSSDSFVGESIAALLRALEKLHRTKEMSVSSEMWDTVENLLGHNSSRVQGGARLLFDNWKRGRVTDLVESGGSEYEISNTAAITGENNGPQCSAKYGLVSRLSSPEGNDGTDATKIGNHLSSLEVVQPENTGDLPVETTYDKREPHLNSNHSDMENVPMNEELLAKTVEETASHETCSLPVSTQENIEVSEAQKLNGLTSDEKLFDMTVSNSSTVEHALVSSDAGVGSAPEVSTESSSQNDSEANRSNVVKSVYFTNEKTRASEPKKAMSDYELMYKNHGDVETRFTSSPVGINTTSDIDLEYGIVDALEVALKVAQEVEREVIDDRVPFSWSSDKFSDDITGSINGKRDITTEVLPEEVPSGPAQSADAVNESESELQDMESSQLTVAQDTEPNADKSLCDFDLNEEVCADDTEQAVTSTSTPVSVVFASRAAAVHGLPASPLRFEGTLGWKGSAATSAFRPAPPRRNSEVNKTRSIQGASSSSKQRLSLDFDLNVAEAGDEKDAELMSGKPERLELDLNCSDDGDATTLYPRLEDRLFYDRNVHHSQSSAVASSSIHPYPRNFDLNDGPYSDINALKQGSYPGRSSRNAIADGGPKPNDPIISIMGTRVELNRNDFVSPAFSSNGLSMAPRMSFPSIYGPSGSIPYIVDSGAPVVPQRMTSTSDVPLAYSQAQFFMSLNHASASSNGSGPSRSRTNFDLNPGLAIEGRTTDFMGLRHPFMPGQGRSIEEHLRANTPASSSSGVAVKRKEPDSGWEPYTFNYRQQQFPWKQ